jgi:hypothetical protein
MSPIREDTEGCASTCWLGSFNLPIGGHVMAATELARFEQLLTTMTQAMKLHGLRHKTIDSYRRTMVRVAGHFGRCPDDLKPDDLKPDDLKPDDLKPDELKTYFAALLEEYSWSTIKVDLSSLQFLHRYVLEREMEWVTIVRPPRIQCP